MKIFMVNGDGMFVQMFRSFGFEIVDSITKADAVQFTGGEDVYPPFYGAKADPRTYSNLNRDYREQKIFHECIERGLPMLGVCRGGQFLNVMNGGKMIQHVDGHAWREGHEAFDIIGDKMVQVSSTHHQMMVPSPEASILMTAAIVGKCDIEALWYEGTKSLCFQPHPEYTSPAALSCREVYREYINKYVLNAF